MSPTPLPTLPQPAPERLALADGTIRAVRRWGPRERPTFLLLHGMESHAGWFDAVGRALAARGLGAVAYDRRGWGASDGERGRLDAPQHALAELALVSAAIFGAARPHLVGLSWGGLLALAARLATPDAFASLTLLVPALFPKRRVSAGARLKAALAGVPGLRALVPLQVTLPIEDRDFSAAPAALAFVGQDPLRVREVHAGFLLTTFRMQLQVRDAARLAMPATLLLAAEDALIDGPKTETFARALGASCATLPATRHSLVFDAPDAVAAHLAGQVII